MNYACRLGRNGLPIKGRAMILKAMISFTLLLLGSFVVVGPGMAEGTFRIKPAFISSLEISSGVSDDSLSIFVPSKSAPTTWQINRDSKHIPESSDQRYLHFIPSDTKLAGKELTISSFILTNELIEKIRTPLVLRDKTEVMDLLNSSDPKDLKKLLFGEKSKGETGRGESTENILRPAGLLELKRRWQDTDEYEKLMFSETYKDVEDFGPKYFIPTGFVGVGEGEYLRVDDLQDDSIEINLKEAKVKIVKDVIFYRIGEISSENLSESDKKDLGVVSAMIKCSENCTFNADAEVGSLVNDMLVVLQKSKDSVKSQIARLKEGFQKLCGNIQAETSKTPEDDLLFESLARTYPKLSVKKYEELHSIGLSPRQAFYYLQHLGKNEKTIDPADARSFKQREGDLVEEVMALNLAEKNMVPFLLKEKKKFGLEALSAEMAGEFINRGWTFENISRLGDVIFENKKILMKKGISTQKAYEHFLERAIPFQADPVEYLKAEMKEFI